MILTSLYNLLVVIQDSTIFNEKKVSECEEQTADVKLHDQEELLQVKPDDENEGSDGKTEVREQVAEIKLGNNEQSDVVKSGENESSNEQEQVPELNLDNEEQDIVIKNHEHEIASMNGDGDSPKILISKFNIKDCSVKLVKIKDECKTSPSKKELSLSPKNTKSSLNSIPCEYCSEEFSTFWKKRNHFLTVHQKELTCDVCNNSFKSVKKLEVHKKTHTTEYQCKICNKCFARIDILDTHFLTKHIRIKPFTCKYCGKTFNVRVALLRHERHHKKKNNSQSIRCRFCNRFFEKLLHLKKHVQLFHNEKKLVCEHCGARHNSVSSLKNHLLTHEGFECNECGESFLKKSYLKNHILMQCKKENNVQGNESPKKDDSDYKGVTHRCDICWKSFVTKKNHERHMMKFHDEKKNYNCQVCRIKFESEEEMKKHIHVKCKICDGSFTNIDGHMVEAHGADRPHKCNVCGQAFSAASFLRWHEKKHKNEFSCEYCFRQFGRSIFLESHILRKHTIDRLFECSLCVNKKYPSAELLREHVNVMHTEGSFECEFCKKVFGRFVFLERHIDQLHSIGKQIQCDFCPKKFATNNLLIKHEMFHLNSFECINCGKIFKTNECLRKHVSYEHNIFTDVEMKDESSKMSIDEDCSINIGSQSINLTFPNPISYGSFLTDIDKESDEEFEEKKPISFECTCCMAIFFSYDALVQHIADEHTTYACSTHVNLKIKENLSVKVKTEIDCLKNVEDHEMVETMSDVDVVN